MKNHINLQKRILSGIAILFLILILFPIIIIKQVREKNKYVLEISDNYHPSILHLSNLSNYIKESGNILLFGEFPDDSISEDAKRDLFENKIYKTLDKLTDLSVNWDKRDHDLFLNTSSLIRDSLYFSYNKILTQIRFQKINYSGNSAFLIQKINENLIALIDQKQNELTSTFKILNESTERTKDLITIFFIVLSLALILFIYITFLYFKKTLKKIESSLKELSQGLIPQQIKIYSKDEFAKVFLLLNDLFTYLKNLTNVSNQILKKEFNKDFKPLSEKDELGIALRNLQVNLKLSSEEEMRYKEEAFERNWTSEGIARINEILRSSSDNLEELAYNLIKEIVEYTSSKVGALFIMTDSESEENSIDLLATFAYDRKKFIAKKILVGEGLVGRCALENETIYLSDVPKGYITIKSGMGESDPASILIVPLHLNEKVFGVVEIASFEKYEPHKINFVETIGESIAITISKVKINYQTIQLLAQTRMQAEEMAAQDEELRQNMEELRATQEQSAIREENLRKEIELLRRKS